MMQRAQGKLERLAATSASAILMCGESRLTEPEIQAFCKEIVSGQRAEIRQMEAKLRAF